MAAKKKSESKSESTEEWALRRLVQAFEHKVAKLHLIEAARVARKAGYEQGLSDLQGAINVSLRLTPRKTEMLNELVRKLKS